MFNYFIELHKTEEEYTPTQQFKNDCCSLLCNVKVNLKPEENKVIVKGHIKTVQDYLCVKECIEVLLKNYKTKQINVVLKESYTMTSALIGYLLKLKIHDKVEVYLYVENEELCMLLESLGLTQALNVKIIDNDIKEAM